MHRRQIVAIILSILALSVCGCSSNITVMGQSAALSPTATGQANIQFWRKFGALQLPDGESGSINDELSHLLFVSQPQSCQSGPSTIKLSQRALFNHLASVLKDRPQKDLSPFAVGPIDQLPSQCQRLILITGRLGGKQPGWLAAGLLSVTDGRLLRLAVVRPPAQDAITQPEVLALSRPLIASLNGSTP